ncbi:MAG: hypothetical protein QM785_01230 [Pyrinomonadaceae bacterium]
MENSYSNRFALDVNWEKHRGGPGRPVCERLHATIGPKHRILINRNLYRLLGSPAEVLLYFNAKVSKIAIEAVNPGTTDAFPVINRRGSYEIPAAAFCRTNDIVIRATHKFLNLNATGQGRLFLDLKRTMIVRRRSRKSLTKE